jgi:tetratricopeptide (TPR) repeat protein
MELTQDEKIALYKAQQEIQKNNNVHNAQNIIHEFLETHSDQKISPELYLYLGNLYYDKDQYAQAAQVYSDGLQQHRQNLSLILNYAVSSYRNEAYHEAGEYFYKAYALQKNLQDTSEPQLLFKAATAFYRAEDLPKSKDVLYELIQSTDAPDEKWYKLVIRITYELKDWNGLENDIHNFLKKFPNHSEYWKLLAQAYLEQEEYIKAASVLEIVNTIFSGTQEDWKQLANLYLYIDDPGRAAQILEKRVYGQISNAAECERLARLFFRSLEYEKAITYINMALEKEETAKRYFMKGEFYYRNTEYRKALQAFQASLRMDPDQGKTHLFLGFAANETGDLTLAKKAFKNAAQFKKYKTWAEANLSSIDELLSLRGEG